MMKLFSRVNAVAVRTAFLMRFFSLAASFP